MRTSVADNISRVWNTFIDWEVFIAVFPKLLLQGLPNTLLLSFYSAIIGTVCGLFLAIGVMNRRWYVRVPSTWYVNILRASPAMLSIYVIGQGLPLAGIQIFGTNTYGYAALGVGLMEAAYLAEVFRSGMQSVDRVYIESGTALGLSRLRILSKIIIPIGIRKVIPALTNQYIIVIKATSMVYLLGLSVNQRDLFSMAKDEVSMRGTLAPLMVAGALYLAITLPMTWLVNRADKKLRNENRDQADTSTIQQATRVGV